MMNSPLCIWLDGIEDIFWRMIRGVFGFIFHRLPELIYRTLFETVGPATIRVFRVLFVLCVWLCVVFGPFVGAVSLGLTFWGFAVALTWLVLAIIGSAWGRRCLVRKLQLVALQKAVDAAAPCVDGLSPAGQCP